MRKLLPITVALTATMAAPVTLTAQDSGSSSETARDRSMIVGFLEDNLSGAGRDIRIEGFKGLLSSSATLDTLTIADDQGVWFTLKGAELDWSRTALLSGRLEVTRIAAKEILFDRLPDAAQTSAKVPAPEATPFSLPDLPVSIDIGAIEAERVRLGAPVLKIGTPVEIKLSGSAQLADGTGQTALDITRIDGPDGQFSLSAGFDNATDELDLDLSLSEGAGGIVSTLANLPGAPSLSLVAKGSGPLDGFTSDIALSTDGQQRLTGRVALAAEPDPDHPDAAAPRRFTADLSGDLTPLFSPDYAAFFGDASMLSAKGLTRPAGGFDLESFILSTRTLLLTGALDLAADGLPSSFDLSGTLVSPEGTPVLLPFGSARSTVQDAAIRATYDAQKGDSWSADVDLNSYAQDGLSLGKATFKALGSISRQKSSEDITTLGQVKSTFTLTTEDLAFEDPATQVAVGRAPSLSGQLSWDEGKPLAIEAMELKSGTTFASLSGVLDGLSGGLEFIGKLGLETSDLNRFSAVAGQKMSGTLKATANGRIAPLNGTFDLEAQANGSGLRLGMAQIDALTGGNSTITLSAARDESGLTLRHAALTTAALQAQAQGSLSTEAGDLTLTAELDDVARLGVALSGPLSLEANMSRDGTEAQWQSTAAMHGPGGSTARLAGSLAQDFGSADLNLTGTAPLGLSNRFTTAVLTQGDTTFDLRLNGPLRLTSLSGQAQVVPGARAVLSSAGLALTIDKGIVTLNGETAQIDLDARADTGGSLTTSGPITLSGAFPASLAIGINKLGLTDPRLYSTSLDGNLRFEGGLSGGGQVAGKLTLGKTDVTVSPSALGSGGGIPEITHLGASVEVQATRDRAGLIATAKSGGSGASYGLEVTISAPNQIFIRGRGLDAEMGGQLKLRGTTSDVIPVGQFSLIRGRLSLLGKRIVMEEGAVTLQGELDPMMRLVAVTETDDLTVQLITEGSVSAPELTLTSSPELPQDEILARLLFGKSLSEISPLQAAQMAAAVATLTGGGGGLVGSIRDSFGLDDLDLQTSQDGASSLKLGKYISDSVYTDVTIDNAGKTQINLNFDASRNVTIKGSATSDGDTGVGVFFEKDY